MRRRVTRVGVLGTLSLLCASAVLAADVTPPAGNVTASTFQAPNAPGATVDNDLLTRWAADGYGQWIRYDLGATRLVDYVQVAQYQGDTRRGFWDIQVSTDGSTWTTVLSPQNSSTTTNLETYEFPNVNARYVRLKGWGSTSNTSAFNNFTEVKIFDAAGSPEAPSTAPPFCVSYPQLPVDMNDGQATRVNYVGSVLTSTTINDPTSGRPSKIPDYSYAGYRYGEQQIPYVPQVLAGPTPRGPGLDDTANIQAAINAVAAMPPNAFGIRGAVVLPPGDFRVDGVINVNASGVVLRGAGSGASGDIVGNDADGPGTPDPATTTILNAYGNTPAARDVVVLGSGVGGGWTEASATRRDITTTNVAVGSKSFDVTDASPFLPGDEIVIHHPSTLDWVAAVGGDLCNGNADGPYDTSDVTNNTCLNDGGSYWTPGNHDITYYRRVTAISGNTVTVDVPVYTHLDQGWGPGPLATSWIAKVTWNRIRNSGLEDLRVNIVPVDNVNCATCPTAGTYDWVTGGNPYPYNATWWSFNTGGVNPFDAHAESAVMVMGAEDSWVRNVVALHFKLSGIVVEKAVRITIEDCDALDPVAFKTGGNWYSLNVNRYAQQVLFTKCRVRSARHGIISNGVEQVSGVVWHRIETYDGEAMEVSHRMWGTGLLADSIYERLAGSQVKLMNRGDFGTAHGWACAHSTVWRPNRSPEVQKPYTAQNYGVTGGGIAFDQTYTFPGGTGDVQILAGELVPTSLYEGQMCSRLCDEVQAPANLTATPNGNNRIDLAWTGAAASYNVYRGRQPGGPYTLLGSTAATTYIDNAAQGGITYLYVVKAIGICESVASLEAAATAVGYCGQPPDFGGLVSVTNVAGTTCTLRPAWNAATSACGGTVSYSVYRSTSSTFTPSPATRIATGVTGLNYTDSAALAAATTYYYTVRATSSSNNEEDTNIVRGAGIPGACTASAPDPLTLLTVRSGHNQNVVQWVNSVAGYARTHVVFRTDVFPTGPSDPGATPLGAPADFAGTAGGAAFTNHTATNGTTYYYAAYVDNGTGVYSSGRFVSATPFATTGPLKWAYHTEATMMSPPGVSGNALYFASNDRVLHSVVRGSSGGSWPALYLPLVTNGPSQHLTPAVLTSVIPGATRVVLLGSQDGHVYAVNALTGVQLWQSPLLGESIQAMPTGMFTSFGGIVDHILVGTRNSSADNRFYALAAVNGALVSSFDAGGGANGIGIISSTATVDYAGQRVYFTSRAKGGGSGVTLRCLRITLGGVADTCPGWVHQAVDDVDGTVTRRGNRLYLGTNTGTVRAFDVDTGAPQWTFSTGDGPVKGMVFPDRLSDRVYLATTTKVWGLTDAGTQAWPEVTLPGPSQAVFTTGGRYLIAGGSDGRLYQLDISGAGPPPGGPAPTVKSLLLDATAALGAPTLDVVNNLVYVGTDAGVVYAVQFPLP